MSYFVEDELKTYGKMQVGGEPSIRVPGEVTNYLGIHIQDGELERLGVIKVDKEVPIVWQICTFKREHSDLDIINVLSLVNPSEVFVPPNGIDDEVVCYNRNNLKPEKVGHLPCGWSELWLSLDYTKPLLPQVKSYIDSCVADFHKEYFEERNEEIRKMLVEGPTSQKKFYTTEDGIEVNLSRLQVGRMSVEDYQKAHEGMVFGCQDIMLEYQGGLLLVIRDNLPAKGVLWPIGGRVEKGLKPKESLIKKVKGECGLGLEGDLIYLGEGRTAFNTDPFGHTHGTDTTNERYFARATGKLSLDKLHKNPRIIKPGDYTPDFRKGLEEYVRDFMDLSMLFVKGMDPVLLHSYLAESLGAIHNI